MGCIFHFFDLEAGVEELEDVSSAAPVNTER
jgi:hypothetical protein